MFRGGPHWCGWASASEFWADNAGVSLAATEHGPFQVCVKDSDYQPPVTPFGPAYY